MYAYIFEYIGCFRTWHIHTKHLSTTNRSIRIDWCQRPPVGPWGGGTPPPLDGLHAFPVYLRWTQKALLDAHRRSAVPTKGECWLSRATSAVDAGAMFWGLRMDNIRHTFPVSIRLSNGALMPS